jgi:murein L,D-transpeptidase YcbB/YkuD
MLKKGLTLLMLAIGGAALATPMAAGDRQAALAAMARAGDDGLDPGRYRADPQDAGSVRAALLSYMSDMENGRPELLARDPDVSLPTRGFDAAAALDSRNGDLASLLSGLSPPFPEYARLKAGLAHYRAIAARGGWPVLASGADPQQLRARLTFEDGDTSDVGDALKRFQTRHGLAADGKLGPATLAALNIPAGARADIIAANMERWRWLPRTLEPDRIVINAVDARLELFLNGRSMLVSRVIVGKPATPTPILRAEGAGVTFNPSWTVPTSIAAREILPKLKRNPAWLASQDMILLDGPPGDPQGLHVNWRAIRAGTFPYRVRQNPGAKNPLGLIKIELPNRFDVYLHDTPAKSAFNAPSRDVSHGCVRVEQILPLASYALAGDLSATGRITDAIAAGQTSYLALQRKLPVYFLYWTAFADPDGAMEFRPDIYGRDKRMIAAMGHSSSFAGSPIRCSRA